MAGKYGGLADFLAATPDDSIRLTFGQIEAIIGDRLPDSARHHRAWWANTTSSHPHARSWLDVGWRVDAVDLSAELATFTRQERPLADGHASP